MLVKSGLLLQDDRTYYLQNGGFSAVIHSELGFTKGAVWERDWRFILGMC